ncbi:MAG TPA: hypothetical protein ENF47_00030, partial [Thermoprotei archaeon]|nr:hypothetical protein [Thermoprotei archaeon]
MNEDISKRIEQLLNEANRIKQISDEIKQWIEALNKDIMSKIKYLLAQAYPNIVDSELENFIKKPYAVIPRREDEWLLVVPKFIGGYNYGYLFQETESYRIYVVNRWISWIYELPEQLREELGLDKPSTAAYVEDNILKVPKSLQDEFWIKYRKYLVRRVDEERLLIKKSRYPELLLQLVQDGIIPYQPKAVDESDLIDRECSITLRDYQRDAYDFFMRYGNIGVFWAPGLGKMYLALYIMTKLKGRKLIIVPTRTLIEEWTRKIRALTPLEPDEYQIITYSAVNYPSFKKILNEKWTLTIYDEVHRLPADTFSRLAWINTKYRIGLSATPMREDGREHLIFALSGYPIGVNWDKFRKYGLIKPPEIDVIIVKNQRMKIEYLNKLINRYDGRRIIFCDSIDMGKMIANKFNIPFVYGSSRKRLEVIESNPIVVLSRVGDEGIDITDIKAIFEVSFLYGSRRQQLQRLGRLLHSRYKGYYAILMTKDEFKQYKK